MFGTCLNNTLNDSNKHTTVYGDKNDGKRGRARPASGCLMYNFSSRLFPPQFTAAMTASSVGREESTSPKAEYSPAFGVSSIHVPTYLFFLTL